MGHSIHFGRNKILLNLKRQNKLNFIVSTCRSIRPPPYPPVKNVPALVSYDMMEGKRHTNKPKAMDDDDTTLSAEDFAFLVNASNKLSLLIPKQVFITSYNKASPQNNEMEQQDNDATQPQDDETPQNNNPTRHKLKITTATKKTSTTVQHQPLFSTNDNATQENNKQPHDDETQQDNNPTQQKLTTTTATTKTSTSGKNQPFLPTNDDATQQKNKLTQQNNDATKMKDNETQMTNNATQNDTKKTKKLGSRGHILALIPNVLQLTLCTTPTSKMKYSFIVCCMKLHGKLHLVRLPVLGMG